MNNVQQELVRSRALLQLRDEEIAFWKSRAESRGAQAADLRSENDILRKMVENKDANIDSLNEQISKMQVSQTLKEQGAMVAGETVPEQEEPEDYLIQEEQSVEDAQCDDPNCVCKEPGWEPCGDSDCVDCKHSNEVENVREMKPVDSVDIGKEGVRRVQAEGQPDYFAEQHVPGQWHTSDRKFIVYEEQDEETGQVVYRPYAREADAFFDERYGRLEFALKRCYFTALGGRT